MFFDQRRRNEMGLLAIKARISAYGEKSLVRYVISGFFNTGLGLVIYAAGVLLGFGYVAANFIAWAIGVVVAFLLASRYVFRTPVTYKRFPIFVLSNAVALATSTAMLFVLVRNFFMNPILAAVVAIPVVVAVNFLALKCIVFR